MSRAFVKEDTGAEPALVRAWGGALPPGTPNLATPWSVAQPRGRARRTARRAPAAPRGHERCRARPRRRARRRDPCARAYLPTLQVVTPPAAPERAAFATRVHIEGPAGERTVNVVGIDEASPANGRVSFVARSGGRCSGRPRGTPSPCARRTATRSGTSSPSPPRIKLTAVVNHGKRRAVLVAADRAGAPAPSTPRPPAGTRASRR